MSGRKKKRGGFNTPFTGLTLPRIEAPEAPAEGKTSSKAPPPAPEEVDEDSALFLEAARGATPLPGGDGERVEPPKRGLAQLPDDEELARQELEAFVAGAGEFALQETGESASGRAPGVSRQILEDLSRGAYSFRRHLDLHGLSREEAREAVITFVATARREGERCVLIVTGRGNRSPGGVSVLRETLPRWLSRSPLRTHVLAFSNARVVDGGPGAFYVLLRRAGVRPFGGWRQG